jgi:hypothetical protein
MSRVVLGFGSHPAITPHDSTGLALLLGTMGTPASMTLAEKLSQESEPDRHVSQNVELTQPEQAALMAALDDLPTAALPGYLRHLRQELAETLPNYRSADTDRLPP